MNNRCSCFRTTALLLAALGGLAAADIDFTSPHATYATGVGPRTVAIGRLDNNASNDLVIGNGGGNSISVLLNNGTGTFGPKTDLAVPANPSSVAVVDLNGDSKNDVVVASQSGLGSISIFLGNGDGTFLPRTDIAASAALVAMRIIDVDGDGKLDVIAGGTGIDFFKGNGLGGFATVVRIMSTGYTNSVTVGDLNGDGKIDIACTNISRLTTLFGNGDGTFAAPVTHDTGAEDLSVGMGDFNGDGLNDLAETHYFGPTYEVAVLLNLGAGAFGPPTTFATGVNPKALMIADLDGDGHQDLVCVNVASYTVGILRGIGDGTFHPHFGYLTGAGPYVDAIGYLDGNGTLDFATANTGTNNVSVLLQGTGAAPAAVVDLNSNLVTDQYARLTWTTPTVESYGPATHYDLRILAGATLTAGTFSTATAVIPQPLVERVGLPVTHLLSGLTAGTFYSVALTCTDAFGRTSALSNVHTFTTQASDVTAPVLTSLTIANVGNNYLMLNWIAPGDDGNIGNASAYDLRMSDVPITTNAIYDAATPLSTPTPLSPGTTQSRLVTGLTPGTTYYFVLTALDEVPNPSARIYVSGTTYLDDLVAPAAVDDLAVGTATTASLTVTWSATGDDGLVGQATSYDLRRSGATITDLNFAAATPVSGVPAPGISGTAESLVVTGLTASTTYHFAIRVIDESGNASVTSLDASGTTSAPGGSGSSGGGGSSSGGCGLGSGLATLLLVGGFLLTTRLRQR